MEKNINTLKPTGTNKVSESYLDFLGLRSTTVAAVTVITLLGGCAQNGVNHHNGNGSNFPRADIGDIVKEKERDNIIKAYFSVFKVSSHNIKSIDSVGENYFLQFFLSNCRNDFDILGITGEDEIKKCVSDFQKDQGLKVDGIFGPKTFFAYEISRSNDPEVKKSIELIGVDVLGFFLLYNFTITDYQKLGFVESVKKFQEEECLVADGIVGRNTMDRLYEKLKGIQVETCNPEL